MLVKVYEDAVVEVYRLEKREASRKDVARKLKKQPTDMFNIVNDDNIKYYSYQLPAHKKVLEMYAKYGSPIVIVWKKLPEHLHI